MTGFCDRAWQRTTELRAAIHGLPFNRELAAGTLDQARFKFYIAQDAIYLDQYSRILAIAGARGPDGATLRLFAECALEAVAVEQALHGQYLTQFGTGAKAAEPSPDCLSYTSFLLATAYHEPWEVLMAALLPCFWIYWDDTYSDEAFGNAVRAVISATDIAAAAATDTMHTRMMTAFTRSMQYEYLFWDGAYQLRLWPVGARADLGLPASGDSDE
jgi:thiaminase/transcriptional activator TenA